MVIDKVCVCFGRLLVIIRVVLNLFRVCVKVSNILVVILCVVSGRLIWKNMLVLEMFSMWVVFFS